MSDYELFQEHAPGRRQAKEQEAHHDGDGHDHATVAKAIQHGRPDTLGAKGASHLQRMAGNAATSSLVAQREEDPVHNVLNGSGGSGLDNTTKTSMESRFGQDFSSVKVHQGPQAADAAKSVQAQAFTVGDNIVLGEGKSPSDERTMAHELTHVVQQRSGDVPGQSIGNGLKLSDPGDWAERQAEATADAVVSKGGDSHAGHDHGANAGAGGAKASVQTMPDEAQQDVQTLPLQRQEEEAPEEEGEQPAQTLPMQRQEEEAPEEEGSE